MAKILKQNVVLRRAISESPVVFLEGEALPAEYEHLVGDHLFTEGAAPKKAKAKAESKKAEPLAPSPEEEGLTVPGRNASKATWLKFAQANDIVVPENAGRDDIVDLVKAKLPDLDV